MPKLDILNRLVELDKEIKELKARVNESEKTFSKAYVAFLSYKENADLIDGFEITLNTLKDEKPRILESLARISENFKTLRLLVDDILDGNVNYTP
jgi:predicted  nucleic acid-binding Zn-ribbon protein